MTMIMLSTGATIRESLNLLRRYSPNLPPLERQLMRIVMMQTQKRIFLSLKGVAMGGKNDGSGTF